MVRRNQVSNTVTLPVGMALKLKVPVDLRTGKGHFPTRKDKVYIKGAERDAIYGFAVEYPDVGKLEPNMDAINAGEHEVLYIQDKNKENKIYFFTDTGLMQIVNVIPIPVHDHSSVQQGGPAFGTYAAAYTNEELSPMEDNV